MRRKHMFIHMSTRSADIGAAARLCEPESSYVFTACVVMAYAVMDYVVMA